MKPENQSENKTTAASATLTSTTQQGNLIALDDTVSTFLQAFNFTEAEIEELHQCNQGKYFTIGEKAKAQYIKLNSDQWEALASSQYLKPSFIVKTAGKVFVYWLIKDGTQKEWREIQARLIYYFNSSIEAYNAKELLPVPGTNTSGEAVELSEFNPGALYTQQQFIDLLPAIDTYKRAQLDNSLLSDDEALTEEELKEMVKDISNEAQDMAQDIAGVMAEIERPCEIKINNFIRTIQTETYKPYKTELTFFDDLLGGGVIRQSIVQVLAAPSAGKTTLCQQIAEEMASHGKKVLYFNFEMSNEQMLAKAISYRLAKKSDGAKKPISATDILQGYNWDDYKRERIISELNEYKQTAAQNITYNHALTDINNIKDLLQEIGDRAAQRGMQAPAVFVDYLHLITGAGYGNNAQEIIKEAVKCFKDYAIKYKTVVFLIVAVNRNSMKNGQITLTSGRDSSAIEYSGDYVLSLNYEEIDNGNIEADDEAELAKIKQGSWRKMILRVLKHRLGVPGLDCKLWFKPAENIFYNAAGFVPDYPERDKIEEKARQRTLDRVNKAKHKTSEQPAELIKQDDTPPASFLEPKKA